MGTTNAPTDMANTSSKSAGQKTNVKASTGNGGKGKITNSIRRRSNNVQDKMTQMRTKIPQVEFKIDTKKNTRVLKINGKSYSYNKFAKTVPSPPSANKVSNVVKQPKPSRKARAKKYVTDRAQKIKAKAKNMFGKNRKKQKPVKKPSTLSQKIKHYGSKLYPHSRKRLSGGDPAHQQNEHNP